MEKKIKKVNSLESNFLEKVSKSSKVIGKDLVFKSLLLFYALKEKTTPKWAKTTIVSALMYLIFPLDAIPDIIPIVGYTDDLGVIVLALGSVYLSINDIVRAKAKNRFRIIFKEEYL